VPGFDHPSLFSASSLKESQAISLLPLLASIACSRVRFHIFVLRMYISSVSLWMCSKKFKGDERAKSKVAGLKQTKFCLGRLRELSKT